MNFKNPLVICIIVLFVALLALAAWMFFQKREMNRRFEVNDERLRRDDRWLAQLSEAKRHAPRQRVYAEGKTDISVVQEEKSVFPDEDVPEEKDEWIQEKPVLERQNAVSDLLDGLSGGQELVYSDKEEEEIEFDTEEA